MMECKCAECKGSGRTWNLCNGEFECGSCGGKGVEDCEDDYADEPQGYCFNCNNTGWVNCYCGGDLCVCENQGEEPCPECDGGD